MPLQSSDHTYVFLSPLDCLCMARACRICWHLEMWIGWYPSVKSLLLIRHLRQRYDNIIIGGSIFLAVCNEKGGFSYDARTTKSSPMSRRHFPGSRKKYEHVRSPKVAFSRMYSRVYSDIEMNFITVDTIPFTISAFSLSYQEKHYPEFRNNRMCCHLRVPLPVSTAYFATHFVIVPLTWL